MSGRRYLQECSPVLECLRTLLSNRHKLLRKICRSCFRIKLSFQKSNGRSCAIFSTILDLDSWHAFSPVGFSFFLLAQSMDFQKDRRHWGAFDLPSGMVSFRSSKLYVKKKLNQQKECIINFRRRQAFNRVFGDQIPEERKTTMKNSYKDLGRHSVKKSVMAKRLTKV